MGVILDSSVIVAFERRRFDLERLLNAHSPAAIASITAAELLIGVERATPTHRPRREAFVESFLARVIVVPFELPQARIYAIQFAQLATRGELIGDRDLQIASTALHRGDELATLNIGEFQRIPGLKLIDVTTYAVA